MYINNFVRGWAKGGRCFHPANDDNLGELVMAKENFTER
jgi:hypothetical protein